jgi:hypothetical protein
MVSRAVMVFVTWSGGVGLLAAVTVSKGVALSGVAAGTTEGVRPA